MQSSHPSLVNLYQYIALLRISNQEFEACVLGSSWMDQGFRSMCRKICRINHQLKTSPQSIGMNLDRNFHFPVTVGPQQVDRLHFSLNLSEEMERRGLSVDVFTYRWIGLDWQVVRMPYGCSFLPQWFQGIRGALVWTCQDILPVFRGVKDTSDKQSQKHVQYAVCHFQKGPFTLCQDAEVLRGKVGCLLLTGNMGYSLSSLFKTFQDQVATLHWP